MRCHMLVFSVRYSCRICECCNYIWRYDKVTKSRNLWCSCVCDMCTVNAKGGKKYDVDNIKVKRTKSLREVKMKSKSAHVCLFISTQWHYEIKNGRPFKTTKSSSLRWNNRPSNSVNNKICCFFTRRKKTVFIAFNFNKLLVHHGSE